MAWAESWAARCGVIAAAATVGAVAASLVDSDGEDLDATVPRGATVEMPTTTEPPTRDEVRAAIEVEAGVTPGDLGSLGDGVSFGVVLENTGDQVIAGIPVSYRFTTADGTGGARRHPPGRPRQRTDDAEVVAGPALGLRGHVPPRRAGDEADRGRGG
jgi:hypothetical protein